MLVPDEPQVVLIRVLNGTQHPALRFQVTVRPDRVMDDRIRFGNTQGDELVGWWPLDDLLVDRVLGKPTEDGKGYTNA